MTVTPAEAERLVARNQANWKSRKRILRLAHHYQMPESGGRTRTSRGALMGAIGRSQHYTIEDVKGRVTGFKHIDPVDLPIFYQATLGECL